MSQPDGTALARRLHRLRGVVQGAPSVRTLGDAHGARAPSDAQGVRTPSDPRALAEQVLKACAHELGLPAMGIWWRLDVDGWGVVQPDHPTVLQLNKLLLVDPPRLVESVAHECMHAARILSGDAVFDVEAERAATDYGRTVRARWGYL